MISLALIVVFVVALGQLGSYDDRNERAFEKAVLTIPDRLRPKRERGKNDTIGNQRWVFDRRSLFGDGVALSESGREAMAAFGLVLAQFERRWIRIRIEGHTTPKQWSAIDDWETSAGRAAAAARELERAGIKPWYLGVAGRAGQSPLTKVLIIGPSGKAIEEFQRNLKRFGIAYSRSSAAKVKIPEDKRPASAFIAVLHNGTFDRSFVSPSDGDLHSLQERFLENERVEIIIEYLAHPGDFNAP